MVGEHQTNTKTKANESKRKQTNIKTKANESKQTSKRKQTKANKHQNESKRKQTNIKTKANEHQKKRKRKQSIMGGGRMGESSRAFDTACRRSRTLKKAEGSEDLPRDEVGAKER
ncbi:MAG: hypothetical protein ACXIT9_00275 [Nitritalea sp.]